VIEIKVFEGTNYLNTALSSGMTSLWLIVAFARSGLREE
jgi:hypothetical protein